MRIKVCSPQLGIAPESNSGGEVYDREVIKAFCNHGIKVITILPKNKPYLIDKNLKAYYLPFPFIWPPYLFNIFIIPWLFWLYKKYNFNVLRIHSPYFVGLGALVFKFFHPKIPLVAVYHHLEPKKHVYNLINRLFIHQWNIIIADSQFTKDQIIKKYKVGESKIKIIYAGVEKRFKNIPKKKSLVKKYQLKGKKVLFFLGELKPRKNLKFLIKVFNKIDNLGVKLLICGQGKLFDSLKKQVQGLGLENKVIFTGYIPEKEKVDYYNLADIFLFPSSLEGFGMPIIEAGACSVPSIASDISSLKELVLNRKTGYLARFSDLDDWKKKIEELLENENLRKRMGLAGRKFSQRFSWNKTVEKQLVIYKNLLEKI